MMIEPGKGWYRMRKKSVKPTHWLYFEAPSWSDANDKAMRYFGHGTRRELEVVKEPVQAIQANISGWLYIEAAL